MGEIPFSWVTPQIPSWEITEFLKDWSFLSLQDSYLYRSQIPSSSFLAFLAVTDPRAGNELHILHSSIVQ